MTKLLLASTSPTRKKILKKIGIRFISIKPLIDEEKEKKKLFKLKKPEKICQNLAKQKSIKTSVKHPTKYVIGVDTCLIYRQNFLSKPKSKKEAEKLLKKLNGKKHRIYSSIFISKNGKIIWNFNDEAELKVRNLSSLEILKYIKKQKIRNLKQSGLYQIENTGITLFEKINGSYFTILGIPLMPLLNFLQKRRLLF